MSAPGEARAPGHGDQPTDHLAAGPSDQPAHQPASVAERRPTIDAAHFAACDLRVGTVVGCAPIPGAHRPSYRLTIDLGPLGQVESAARICDFYRPEDLVGTQVVCVANLPPRQVGPVRSQVLVLGAYVEGTERVALLRPDRPCRNGDRIG
jgi:tRNA-binding protein